MAHNKTALTGVGHTFSDDEFIISMTDAKGILTYVNDVFIRLAGFKEKELVGQPHNIVRHPDMPRCIFKLLWDTISSGDELLAYVVNKSKNGDHYWVYAHATPTRDESGNIIGYLSSRRNVTEEAMSVIKPLYRALCAEEQKHSSPKEGMQAGMDMLLGILNEKNVEYGEFVIGLEDAA